MDQPEDPVAAATKIEERELILALLANRVTRALLYQVLNVPADTRWFTEVREPFTTSSSKPGDIDVLLGHRSAPHHVISGEVKRIKVRREGTGGQKINKLFQAAKGVEQVRGLLNLGFYRTFLILIAVVDDRSATDLNFLSRGTNEKSFQEIVQFGERAEVDPSVGILYIEISQPVAKEISQAGVVCVGLVRDAACCEQSVDLTSNVANYLKDKDQVI